MFFRARSEKKNLETILKELNIKRPELLYYFKAEHPKRGNDPLNVIYERQNIYPFNYFLPPHVCALGCC